MVILAWDHPNQGIKVRHFDVAGSNSGSNRLPNC